MVAGHPIGVMQICDTLMSGGMERLAVNIANGLPAGRYASHLCTTRARGPLETALAPNVERLHLARRWLFDARALKRLSAYVREREIGILHAHGTSLFVAAFASLLAPRTAVVWHDHFGRFEIEGRPACALSHESPMLPTDGSTPASASRAVYRIERYCTPRSL